MPETLKQAIKAIFGISLAAFSIGFVFGLAFPLKADAAVLVSVPGYDTQTDVVSGSVQWYLSNGTALSGDLSSVTIFTRANTTSGTLNYALNKCNARVTDSNYTGCSSVVSGTVDVTSSTSVSDITKNLSASHSFDASKYYVFQLSTASISFRTYGITSTSTPSILSICPSGGCGTVIQSGIYLFTSPSLSAEGISEINTPTYAQVVSSGNNVQFSYDYNSYSYTRAGFTLVDNTTGQSVVTSSASSTISSSGSGTFNGYLDLVTGHTYTWTPWLSGSITGQADIYGTPTFFFTGSNTSVYIPPAPTSPYATTSFGTVFNGIISTSTTGSTTIRTGTSTNYTTGILDQDLDNALRSRFPFSYIYDLLNVLNELASYTSASSSPNAEYTLPFNKVLDNGSTTVTIIDTQAVRAIPAVSEARQLIAYTIYLMTAFAIVGAVASIL